MQKEIERRRPNRRRLHRSSPFNAKIVCGDCGGFYGRKVWHSGSKYEKSIWRCNRKYDGESGCTTPNLDETEIERAFVAAFNQLLKAKEKHIAGLERLQDTLADTRELEKQLDEQENRHAGLVAGLRRYMEENTRQVQDQTEYSRRFSEMDAACKNAEEQISILQNALLEQAERKERARRSEETLRKCCDTLTEFDTGLWDAMVENVTAAPDKNLTFLFWGGTEVSIPL